MCACVCVESMTTEGEMEELQAQLQQQGTVVTIQATSLVSALPADVTQVHVDGTTAIIQGRLTIAGPSKLKQGSFIPFRPVPSNGRVYLSIIFLPVLFSSCHKKQEDMVLKEGWSMVMGTFTWNII